MSIYSTVATLGEGRETTAVIKPTVKGQEGIEVSGNILPGGNLPDGVSQRSFRFPELNLESLSGKDLTLWRGDGTETKVPTERGVTINSPSTSDKVVVNWTDKQGKDQKAEADQAKVREKAIEPLAAMAAKYFPSETVTLYTALQAFAPAGERYAWWVFGTCAVANCIFFIVYAVKGKKTDAVKKKGKISIPVITLFFISLFLFSIWAFLLFGDKLLPDTIISNWIS